MFKFPNKYKIRVYDVNGDVTETIERFVYRFNRARRKVYGDYLGVQYKNSRPQVYGDYEHPNGLYIFQGDFSAKPTEEIRKRIHSQHVYDERDIVSVG